MKVLTVGGSEKTKPIKANFKFQEYCKRVNETRKKGNKERETAFFMKTSLF